MAISIPTAADIQRAYQDLQAWIPTMELTARTLGKASWMSRPTSSEVFDLFFRDVATDREISVREVLATFRDPEAAEVLRKNSSPIQLLRVWRNQRIPESSARALVERYHLSTEQIQLYLNRAAPVQQQVRGLFSNLDPRKALAGGAGLSAAAASARTILTLPLGTLASETLGVGASATLMLESGAVLVGGTVGAGVGYGIHKGVEALQGESLGAKYYDNFDCVKAFANWTTESKTLNVTEWF